MNLIQKALDECRFNIPREVMELAFLQTGSYDRRIPISLDTRIREKVIDQRVIPDCNLVGGSQVLIPLQGIDPEYVDAPFSAVYRIPKSLTQGRTITTALSVSYGDALTMGGQYVGPEQWNPMLDAGNQMLRASSPVPPVSTAQLELIGENTIFLRDTVSIPSILYLRCIVENAQEMNNIKPASYHAFCKLVVLGVKAFIYNELNIKLDLGQLQGGMNVGRIREVVDSYSDSNELYETHLSEVWRKTAFLNDPETHRRHTRMIVGGGY